MASHSNRQTVDEGGDATSHRSQSSPDSDHVRKALMNAAIDLLAVHGPDGVSSREVAKAAGVNYGLIHYYFGTRNELLRQAIKHETEQWGATNPTIDDVAWTPLMLGVRPPERAWRSLVHLDPTQLKAALVASAYLQIGWLAVSNWHLDSVEATDVERQIIEEFVNDVERSILELAMDKRRAGVARAGFEPTSVDTSSSIG